MVSYMPASTFPLFITGINPELQIIVLINLNLGIDADPPP